MASFSSRAALAAIAAYSVLMLSGCCTGSLIESGRRHYTVIEYSRVAMDGDTLRIDYSLARQGVSKPYADAETMTAELPFDSLLASPTLPVDELALEVQVSSWRNESALPLVLNHRPLPMGSVSANGHGQSRADARDLFQDRELEAWIESVPSDSEMGRPMGFRLCSSDGNVCHARFSSGTLSRDRIALWVYFFAPLTMMVDLGLLPAQIATLPILLAVSD